MVSEEVGCWERSPFHLLDLGTASPLGSTSPPFLPHFQFAECPVCVFADMFAVS